MQCPLEHTHTQADRELQRGAFPCNLSVSAVSCADVCGERCKFDARQSAGAAEWKPALDDCCAIMHGRVHWETLCALRGWKLHCNVNAMLLNQAVALQCSSSKQLRAAAAARVHDRAADAAVAVALQSWRVHLSPRPELLLPAVLPSLPLSACRQSCNVAGGVGGGGGGKQLALLHKSEDMQCSRPSCSWSVAPAVPGTPSAAWVDTLPCRWSAQLTLAQNFQRSSHNISHICRLLLERGKRVKNIYWFNSQFRKVGTSTSSK